MSISVITGTGEFTLGSKIAKLFAKVDQDSCVIGIDQNYCKKTCKNMVNLQFNLNPLDHKGGIDSWRKTLQNNLDNATNSLNATPPYKNVILAAGNYYVAPFLGHGKCIRQEMLGADIVGKVELLHTIMRLNELFGENNDKLTIVDFGSLHSLKNTMHRSLYNCSKNATLSLLLTLYKGREIARLFHIAPGPIDTPMLHRNYWIFKGKGDPKFWEYAYFTNTIMYEQIFRACDESALSNSLGSYGKDEEQIRKVFKCYKQEIKKQFDSDLGIIDPDILSKRIVELITERVHAKSGVYMFSGSNGRFKERHLTFF